MAATTDTERRLGALERRQKRIEEILVEGTLALNKANDRMEQALERIETRHGIKPPGPKLELVEGEDNGDA